MIRHRLLAIALLTALAAGGCRRTSPPPSLAEMARQYVAAWNGERFAGVPGICDEDAIFWWPTTHPILRGRYEITDFMDALDRVWTARHTELNGILVDEAAGKVAVDWTLRARDVATGQAIVRQGTDVLEVHNGTITVVRGQFDTAGLPTPLPSPRATP